jgi:hypothetical protein
VPFILVSGDSGRSTRSLSAKREARGVGKRRSGAGLGDRGRGPVKNMKQLTFHLSAVLILGTFIGWVDLHVEEVQWSVLFLLLFGAVLGVANPSLPWLSALLLGLSIPAAHLIAPLFHVHPIIPPNHFGWTFLALIPAFIGAYAGALVRALVGATQ